MFSKISTRLSRTLQVLLSGKLDASAKRVIPPITPEEVAEAKTFFPMEKFFIFGHARSGTTLLARLVRIHPEVHCNYQGHFFTRPPLLSGMVDGLVFEEWLARPSNRWNRGRDLTPVALRAIIDYILERDARREGKTVVGDKSPNVLLNGQAVREVHNIYPDSALIYIVRDGRDTVISHRFQAFIDASQHLTSKDFRIRDNFAKDPTPYYEGKRSIFTEKDIRRMAEGWARNVYETDQMGRDYYGNRYHALRFEDLLEKPYEAMADVWRSIGVDPSGLEDSVAAEMSSNPDADWQKQKAGDLVATLEKGKRGSWRELFTEQDKDIFKQVAGEILIAWGYEKDMDW